MITEIKAFQVSCDYCHRSPVDTDSRRFDADTKGWGTKYEFKNPLFGRKYLHVCPTCIETKGIRPTVMGISPRT